MNYNIQPEKTAIVNGCSNAINIIINSHEKNERILDFGAGKLRNANHLINNGFDVSIVETTKQLSNLNSSNLAKFSKVYNADTNFDNINDKYDIITCNYVLNVIPDIDNRIKILNNIEKLLDDFGTAYIEVRATAFIKTAKTAITYNDGYVLGKGEVKTFQKPYTKDDITHFIENNSDLSIIKYVHKNDSWCIILKNKKRRY